MEFPLTRVGETNMHLYDSGTESRLQLVFVPGVFSPEAWKYQLNYFSQDYRVISFQPTLSNRDFEGHRNCLKQVLDQEEIDNAVLVGANFSNPIVQSFEARQDVKATVVTGVERKLKKGVPREVYRTLSSDYFPTKLFKKFFLPSLSYREAREFCQSVDFPGFDYFQSFQDRFGVRKPEKECLVVHGEEDFFSDRDYARELMSSASVSVLDAGVFSFYEKPQEFNKTLNDFLMMIERKAVQEEVEEARDQNMTLENFDRKLAEVKKQ